VSQLELKLNACSWCEAQENACEQVIIDFVFYYFLVNEKLGQVFLSQARSTELLSTECPKTKTKPITYKLDWAKTKKVHVIAWLLLTLNWKPL